MPANGEKVRVHYTGTLDDGSVFDSSVERGEPLEFIMGRHMLIPAFEAAVANLAIGEKVSIHIPAAEAYGEYNENMILRAPRSAFGNTEGFSVGDRIMLQTPQGYQQATILELADEVALDFNHEMAGKDLNFVIELVENLGVCADDCDCGCHDHGCDCGCC